MLIKFRLATDTAPNFKLISSAKVRGNMNHPLRNYGPRRQDNAHLRPHGRGMRQSRQQWHGFPLSPTMEHPVSFLELQHLYSARGVTF